MDDRWSDNSKTPLSNGPHRSVTAPTAPRIKLNEKGQLFEFLLPFPMHIVDSTHWPPLEVSWKGFVIQLMKPVSAVGPFEPNERYGNEAPDAFCCILRAFIPREKNSRVAVPDEVWPLMHLLIVWIRVKCRHFWLAHGSVGFGALFRGSAFSPTPRGVEQNNFCKYGRNLIVRPLTKELWSTLVSELAAGLQPPVSESMLCDAFVSAVTGDDGKAVLELGVAAEIELTRLLDEVSCVAPNLPGKEEYRQAVADWKLNSDRLRFSVKLDEWTSKVGLTKPEEFNKPHLPPTWKETVKQLYKLRNRIAHSGELPASTGGAIQEYIFGANAMFSYCRAQGRSARLWLYSYPEELEDPSTQLLAFLGG